LTGVVEGFQSYVVVLVVVVGTVEGEFKHQEGDIVELVIERI